MAMITGTCGSGITPGTGMAGFIKTSFLSKYGGGISPAFSSATELNKFCEALAGGIVLYLQSATDVSPLGVPPLTVAAAPGAVAGIGKLL